MIVVAIGLVFSVLFHVGVSEQHVHSQEQPRQQIECVRSRSASFALLHFL